MGGGGGVAMLRKGWGSTRDRYCSTVRKHEQSQEAGRHSGAE